MPEIVIPYTPNPVQRQIHDLAQRIRFLVVAAHRGAGKSLAAVNEALDAALFTPTEAPRAAYVGPYRNQTKMIAWDYLKRLAAVIPGADFNETELRCDFTHNGGRVFLAGADGCDHLRGVHLDMLVLDEPAFQPPTVWPEILRPTLGARRGRCVMIGTFLEKANHFYQTFDKAASLPEWGRLRVPASESGILSAAELDSNRATMTPEQFAREFELEPMVVTEASIYGKLLAQARKDGRIGHVPHTPGVGVDTAWDFGFRDATAIWFVQRVGVAYHVIDYFQAAGLTVADYADVLKERKREHGYSYGRHYAPHDATSDNIQTGRSIDDTAMECGLYFEIVQRGSVAAGINATRQLIPQCWIDEGTCGEGLDALERYKYEWNPDLQVFSMKPEHSKYSHAADALRTFAVGYQEEPDEDEQSQPAVLDFNVFTYNKGR
jgi:phage terminase large subunit